MKVMTLNANGIRAAAKKGFYSLLDTISPDIVCLQETKAQVAQLTPLSLYFPDNYYCDYFDAEKKGYSGVAIYAKAPPLKVIKGLGFEACDIEGRYIQFDYETFSVISLYLPSGTMGEHRQVVKDDFLIQFLAHLNALKASGRPLIVCGDFNIAHQKIDIKNWQANQKNSGFLPHERAWMDELFNTHGFVDAFRCVNQAPDQYTWWTYRQKAYENNVGWRIDYQIVTEDLREKVVSAEILSELRLSDHAPLIMTYSGVSFD
jgi:exodeoxyribonuclease-3